MTVRTKHPQYRLAAPRILILTGSIGSGHLSVAQNIAEEIRRKSGGTADVEIVDFITQLKNFATAATKKVYLNSLKVSPKIYEVIFARSSDSSWPIKLLNLLSAPFMERKFLKLVQEKNPSILVSTFPIWDLLIKKIWKTYNKNLGAQDRAHAPISRIQPPMSRPFVSVITDSISVHSVWTASDPDFYLVANEDTKIALLHHGVSESKIKVFGYPVAKKFSVPGSKFEFEQKWNLSPKRKTLLIILSTGMRFARVKKMIKAIQQSNMKKLQLLIVAAGQPSWKKTLAKIRWKWPVRITGWTKEMHNLVHGADIVFTKAGGATVSECIAGGKPMVIIDAIPGHEMGNAVLVQKYNLGVVLNRDLSDFDRAISYILKNDALIKKNLSKLQRPEASKNIAQFLLALCANISYNSSLTN